MPVILNRVEVLKVYRHAAARAALEGSQDVEEAAGIGKRKVVDRVPCPGNGAVRSLLLDLPIEDAAVSVAAKA